MIARMEVSWNIPKLWKGISDDQIEYSECVLKKYKGRISPGFLGILLFFKFTVDQFPGRII